MNRPKSAWQVADHRARRLGLQTARLASWWLAPDRWPAPERTTASQLEPLEVLIGVVRAPLLRADGYANPALEVGKRKNLALAAPAFDGIVVAAERPLSFWRTLGRASASRGYTWGAELRGGCVVPAIAGGLCLLSNALFELAVRSGWRIHERHGHSLEAIPPAPGALPLDATVAWPDVDLVIGPEQGRARLAVRLGDDALEVAAFMARPLRERIDLQLDERVEQRGADRVRASRLVRRRLDAGGAVLSVEQVATGVRRILTPDELGKTCLSCDEHRCQDRPRSVVLTALRTPSGR